MKKIKVAVTGADGFLGRYVVKRLKKERNITFFLLDKSKHNLFRTNSLKQLLNNKDVIIHLAAVNRDNNSNLIKVNCLGILGLLEGICKYSPNAKLIFSSSFQVYEKESMYGLSKKFAEELIEYYSKKNNIKSIILRIANIYGSGGKPFYNSAIATFVYQIKTGKPLIINGDGKQKRDYIHVTDVVDAIMKCILYVPETNITNIDICSGTLTSINDLIETLKRKSSRHVMITHNHSLHEAEGDIEKKFSIRKALRLLSWKPTVSLAAGLTSMINDNET